MASSPNIKLGGKAPRRPIKHFILAGERNGLLVHREKTYP